MPFTNIEPISSGLQSINPGLQALASAFSRGFDPATQEVIARNQLLKQLGGGSLSAGIQAKEEQYRKSNEALIKALLQALGVTPKGKTTKGTGKPEGSTAAQFITRAATVDDGSVQPIPRDLPAPVESAIPPTIIDPSAQILASLLSSVGPSSAGSGNLHFPVVDPVAVVNMPSAVDSVAAPMAKDAPVQPVRPVSARSERAGTLSIPYTGLPLAGSTNGSTNNTLNPVTLDPVTHPSAVALPSIPPGMDTQQATISSPQIKIIEDLIRDARNPQVENRAFDLSRLNDGQRDILQRRLNEVGLAGRTLNVDDLQSILSLYSSMISGPNLGDAISSVPPPPLTVSEPLLSMKQGGLVKKDGAGLLEHLLGIERGENLAVLHDGEAVLNKKATKALGENTINRLNEAGKQIPRMQEGGLQTSVWKNPDAMYFTDREQKALNLALRLQLGKESSQDDVDHYMRKVNSLGRLNMTNDHAKKALEYLGLGDKYKVWLESPQTSFLNPITPEAMIMRDIRRKREPQMVQEFEESRTVQGSADESPHSTVSPTAFQRELQENPELLDAAVRAVRMGEEPPLSDPDAVIPVNTGDVAAAPVTAPVTAPVAASGQQPVTDSFTRTPSREGQIAAALASMLRAVGDVPGHLPPQFAPGYQYIGGPPQNVGLDNMLRSIQTFAGGAGIPTAVDTAESKARLARTDADYQQESYPARLSKERADADYQQESYAARLAYLKAQTTALNAEAAGLMAAINAPQASPLTPANILAMATHANRQVQDLQSAIDVFDNHNNSDYWKAVLSLDLVMGKISEKMTYDQMEKEYQAPIKFKNKWLDEEEFDEVMANFRNSGLWFLRDFRTAAQQGMWNMSRGIPSGSASSPGGEADTTRLFALMAN